MSAPVFNLLRAHWAEVAIRAFEEQSECDRGDALGDLLTDLMHWADARSYSFELALHRAGEHYVAERAAEAP